MHDIAIIANELTPYRLALHARIDRELLDTKVHTLYTAAEHETSMPWDMSAITKPNPVFFASGNLRQNGLRQAKSLFCEIRDYIESHRIRLIICNGYGNIFSLLLIQWAAKQRIPLIVRGDSNIFDDRAKPWLTRLVKRHTIRWVCKRAAGLMPMGVAGQAYFRHYGNHALPTFLCPYEPDYHVWQQIMPEALDKMRKTLAWDGQRKRFLYSGRFVPQKRVDLVISAFLALADARPSWDLVLVGDGALRTELEAIVPERLKHRVEFLGFRQLVDLPAIYKCCDVLVHPAEREPWGLIINEAVAAGLPVITTNVVGAALELVRDSINGMLLDPGDAEALHQAMMAISEGSTAKLMAMHSDGVLSEWRRVGDPVKALRRALEYFSE